MGIATLLFLACLIVLVASAAWFVGRKTAAKSPGSARAAVVPSQPTRIVVGESADRAAIELSAFADEDAWNNASAVSTGSSLGGRLVGLLQAAPSLVVASQSAGRRLMEVTINGNLVKAADGNGLRAFSMGARGIEEHARLFDAANLQTAINAAALWQVASVVVAQKHLADINEKLEDIKKAVDGIGARLDQDRAARLEATYQYLQQGAQALAAGELSSSVRDELEACERDLLTIFESLAREYVVELGREIKDDEWFGSGEYTDKLRVKLRKLEDLASAMERCLRTRIGAWRMLSIYPGEPHLVRARRESIESCCARLEQIQSQTHQQTSSEIEEVDSFFNAKSTLQQRRGELSDIRDRALQGLRSGLRKRRVLAADTNRMFEHDKPTVLYGAVEDGAVVELRMKRAQ